MSICAVEYVRRMRGGAQSQLMRASDGALYIVKFQNNPQGKRILANELVATRLAERVGLPVAPCAIIQVQSVLIERTPELRIEDETHSVPCAPGLQAASRFVAETKAPEQVWDWMPAPLVGKTRNLNAFAGMLAFDWWTFNRDSRQAVFSRVGSAHKYTATFIDQGYCFNGTKWTFPETNVPCEYPIRDVYELVDGWGSFEPWLSRIERLRESVLWEAVADLPVEWEVPEDAIEDLINALQERQKRVRGFIEDLRYSTRNPFRSWPAFHATAQTIPEMPSQCSA